MVYVRKIFDHDITHQVSIDSYVFSVFFNSQEHLQFKIFGNNVLFDVRVRFPTDKRLGGDFKELCRWLGYRLGDFLIIEKLPSKIYEIRIAKPNSKNFQKLEKFFVGSQRHLIVSSLSIDPLSCIYRS